MTVADWDEPDWKQVERLEQERAPTRAGIEEQNAFLLQRYRDFRRAADMIVDAWRQHSDVTAIALVGSVARAPWKEVPRFQPYRRKGIELWHECKDLDLAVWLDGTTDLEALRKSKNCAVSRFVDRSRGGIAGHQVDVFLLDDASGRHMGRLCEFNRCPKPRKRECLVPHCGSEPFLRRVQGFRWRSDTISADRSVRLFDRAAGIQFPASSLPLPTLRTDGRPA